MFYCLLPAGRARHRAYAMMSRVSSTRTLMNGSLLALRKTAAGQQRQRMTRKLCVAAEGELRASQTVRAAELCLEREEVKLSYDGRSLRFPWLWLRDNCQCPQCFNPHMQSRTIDWRDVHINGQPKAVNSDGGQLEVQWVDGHSSRFEGAWLWARAFDAEAHAQWIKEIRPPRQSWGSADFPHALHRLRYDDVMQSDSHFLTWLEALAVNGVALLEDAPVEENCVRSLAERVDFIKRTHYGEEFEVRHKRDTTNVAYHSTPLQMHADLPYYEYAPGVTLLHCKAQAQRGAANLLSDGLRVAQVLQSEAPTQYKILTQTFVDWEDDGSDGGLRFLSRNRAPALCEDGDGNLLRINYSQQQRASNFNVSAEEALAWYKAHHAFTQLLYSDELLVRLKLKPGDVLSFDNLRVLHGREGYGEEEERLLIGAYVDWDLILSRIRVLRRSLRAEREA